MLFMRVSFRLEEDARWRLNEKSHRAVRIGTSGSVDLLEGVAQPLGGSIGGRVFSGQTDPEDWLAEADAAMWVRKKGR